MRTDRNICNLTYQRYGKAWLLQTMKSVPTWVPCQLSEEDLAVWQEAGKGDQIPWQVLSVIRIGELELADRPMRPTDFLAELRFGPTVSTVPLIFTPLYVDWEEVQLRLLELVNPPIRVSDQVLDDYQGAVEYTVSLNIVLPTTERRKS